MLMIMMMKRTFLVTLVIAITCLSPAYGFSIEQKSVVAGGSVATPTSMMLPGYYYYSSSTTFSSSSLTMSSNDDDDDQPKKLMEFGQERGLILQAIALAICIWLFTIPPEFRRAYFCGTQFCEENRSRCNDCVTIDEWKTGVADYYKNGGGIQFDFSIDPKTKALWSGEL